MKYLVIIFFLIAVDLHSQALKISRKGEHLGISVASGVSSPIYRIDSLDTPNLAFSINIDAPMYANHYQGIWLKISYSKYSSDTDQSLIKLNLIGMSLRYLWNPPTNSGFFMTVGPTLYFPIVTSIKDKETNLTTDYTIRGEVLLGLGTSLGVSIIKNSYLTLNTGVTFEYIIPELQELNIFTAKVFVGFTYRVNKRNYSYYTK